MNDKEREAAWMAVFRCESKSKVCAAAQALKLEMERMDDYIEEREITNLARKDRES